jgi:hypothetical protein
VSQGRAFVLLGWAPPDTIAYGEVRLDLGSRLSIGVDAGR